MKKNFLSLVFFILSAAPPLLAANEQKLSVIPEPMKTTFQDGTTSRLNVIEKNRDTSQGKEGYKLSITPKGIKVAYADNAGLFYANQTLQQLKVQFGKSIPCVEITDRPRFSWRGLMIDPARHYWTIADIKKFIDVMAAYKFNKLHIHLTDDQGWRLPVPGYPKLQSVASKRTGTNGNNIPHEGFYTKKELKDVVQYAAARQIEVIPEIDVPGHNQALAAAYPDMICFPDKELKVRTTPGVTKELICPAKPEVWKFYNVVFDELRDIFPSSYVHLGGDEAPADNWAKCPHCEKLRKKEGWKDTHEQMGGFFRQMTDLLAKRGKKPLLWYEEGDIAYPEGSTVYSWRMGKTPSTISDSRKKKLNLILAPGEHAYLDYPQLQGDAGVGPLTTLERSYKLDPGYGLSEEDQKHIIGVEGPIWGEYISTLKRAFYMAYPRALALSEAAWSPMDVRSWENFSRKLEFQKEYMKKNWDITLDRPSDDK